MDIYYQPTIQSQTYSDETDRTKLHHPVPTETQSGKLHYDEAIDRSVNATFDSVTNNLTETLDVNHNITTLDNNRFSYQTIGYNVPIIPLSVSANKYSNYSRIGFSESNKSLLRPKTIAVDFSTKGGKLYRGFDETRSSSEFGSYSRPTAVEQSCTTLGPTHITLWEMMYLTSFNFPYGLICGTMGLFVLVSNLLTSCSILYFLEVLAVHVTVFHLSACRSSTFISRYGVYHAWSLTWDCRRFTVRISYS